MSENRQDGSSPSMPEAPPLWHKVWREVARPFRSRKRFQRRQPRPQPMPPTPESPKPFTFDPQDCTVEPEGLALLKNLVRKTSGHGGPIIEVGTLLGITATHMALVKQPSQKIITVDKYCWNPWGLPPDSHHALAQQALLYLTESGHVEQVRMDKALFFDTYRGPAPALVFLDAIHTYEETKKDIEWAIRAGAHLIAGHDYCSKFPGVIQVVDDFGGPQALAGSVWVLHPQAAMRVAA